MDGKLVNYIISRPEWGEDFYAPQTFRDGNRRIMIGWMYHWGKETPADCCFAGALSIPRELKLVDSRVYNFPVKEACSLLTKESAYVQTEGNTLVLRNFENHAVIRELPSLDSVDILEDTKSIEVFVNGGEYSFSYWLN